MSIQVAGLDVLRRDLTGLKKSIVKDLRGAVGKTVTEGAKRVRKTTQKELGLPQKRQRPYLILKRPKQGSVEGEIRALDVPLPLRYYKFRAQKVSPTRASVSAKTEIGKSARTSSSVFVNPKWRRGKIPLRRTGKFHTARKGRHKGRRREKVGTPFGPSMAVHVKAINTPSFERSLSEFMTNDFLQRQRRRIRR